jgi:Ca-activated chloride channel family protein
VLTDSRRQTIRSQLNESQLKQLAEAGNGFYLEAGFRDSDSEEILEASALLKPSADDAGDSTRVWDERFFWPLLILLALLLPAFRRSISRKEAS